MTQSLGLREPTPIMYRGFSTRTTPPKEPPMIAPAVVLTLAAVLGAVHRIRCAHCGNAHRTVADIRACATHPVTHACGWLVETDRWSEDGERIIVECDHVAWTTDRGFQCAGGHEHVNAEIRWNEGWNYAADETEAADLRRHGVDAVSMAGGTI